LLFIKIGIGIYIVAGVCYFISMRFAASANAPFTIYDLLGLGAYFLGKYVAPVLIIIGAIVFLISS